jgi:dimethylhistidine N-methyltransferase
MGSAALAFHDLAPPETSFEAAVLDGLGRARKSIPCQFLYDAKGSALFDAICRTPEYYPTRTEIGILERHAGEIARLIGPRAQLGSGSSYKIRVLLDLLDRPAGYVPIDISSAHLKQAAEAVAADHPGLPVTALCADYMSDLDLPAELERGFRKRVAFFPGSTIGNLLPAEAAGLLRRIHHLIGADGDALIGVDTKKDSAVLNAAYNDAQGVTAEFSLNLLARINRELRGDFDLRRFVHDAAYNPREGRMEIYLRSLADQVVHVAGRGFHVVEGERIHTEYSYKYAPDEFIALARGAGLATPRHWTDAEARFAVYYLRGG